jgi:ATP-dependent exoDNAse (exonuclease V) beta subunit
LPDIIRLMDHQQEQLARRVGHDKTEEARLLHVAATRATQRLIMPLSGSATFAERPAPIAD